MRWMRLLFCAKILRATKVQLGGLAKVNEQSFQREATYVNLRQNGTCFSKQNLLGETIAWALPCVSGRGRRIAPNLFGALVATNEEPRKLTFVGRKGSKSVAQTIELDGMTIAREPKFLSENLVVFPAEGRGQNIFCFPFAGSEVEKIGVSPPKILPPMRLRRRKHNFTRRQLRPARHSDGRDPDTRSEFDCRGHKHDCFKQS